MTITPVAHSYNRSAGEWRNGISLCRAARRWLGGDLGVGRSYGGDSSAVASALDGTIDVTQVFSAK
jgi:hypothetical protein